MIPWSITTANFEFIEVSHPRRSTLSAMRLGLAHLIFCVDASFISPLDIHKARARHARGRLTGGSGNGDLDSQSPGGDVRAVLISNQTGDQWSVSRKVFTQEDEGFVPKVGSQVISTALPTPPLADDSRLWCLRDTGQCWNIA